MWQVQQEEFDVGWRKEAGDVGRGEMVHSFKIPWCSSAGNEQLASRFFPHLSV